MPRKRSSGTSATLDILELVAQQCPEVVGNPFIPHIPHPKQARFLGAHPWNDHVGPPFECLFGGAAGGGKSDALLMAAAQYAWHYPHFRGLLLRRTHTELAKAGALMSRAMQWWIHLGVHWDGTNKKMRFPNGATVEFGYHAHPTDDAYYQGGEWHLVGFDELTHWPDATALEWLTSRVRKNEGDPVPRRVLATSNPGGPGHVWVKARFVDGPSLYIPATIDDNPSLDRDAYRATLMTMHPTRRDQLMRGDWTARDPGDYFRAEWFGPLLDRDLDMPNPDNMQAVRWWDLAASMSDDAARTAGVLMIRTRYGVRAVLHAVAFRQTPGSRDDAIVRQAEIDGRRVVVGIEIEGGSGGSAQFEALAKRLRTAGYRVDGARPRVHPTFEADRNLVEKRLITLAPSSDRGKAGRADPVAACLERGYQRRGEGQDSQAPDWGADAGHATWQEARDGLRLFGGPWTQGYLDELEGFPPESGGLCDLVDATSGAWAWLEAHPFGAGVVPAVRDRRMPAEPQNVHPEDREVLESAPKRTRRWNSI